MALIRTSCTIVMVVMMLVACQPGATPTAQPTMVPPTVQATSQVVTATTSAPTQALPTVTREPSATTAPAAVATATPVPPGTLPDDSASVYLDDRSTAAALMLSYVNAVNRHEYLRAYSYWNSPASYIGSLASFTNGWANTTSEMITFGQIQSDGAAGSIYFTVPAVVVDTSVSGSTHKFASCFILRLPEPANFGAPPIQPLGIERGVKTAISSSTSNANALASACSGPDYPMGASPVTAAVESLGDLSSNNLIDNRSGPVEVISSLINSLNRKEYVRAYSYFQTPLISIGSYSSYAAGFSNTGAVTAMFGTPTLNIGVGQLEYEVPLAMKVATTSRTQQTFVGCYTLLLFNPATQVTLPFKPLGIAGGRFSTVGNSVDVMPLLTTACS